MNPHLNENHITYDISFHAVENITENDNDEEEMDLNIKSISPIKKSTEKVNLNHLLNFLNVHN